MEVKKASAATVINPINTRIVETQINHAVSEPSIHLELNSIFAEQYKVESVLSQNTGEADLYVCSKAQKKYVVKIYRRSNGSKDTLIDALKHIYSPYVAKIYQRGLWKGFTYEILPYYSKGSLAGKKFSYDELRTKIIPELNQGLHALHLKNIIHKDLKPSNIMMGDDGHIAIIDFGISSLRQYGATVIVTKTGMTPEYSAPETFKNLVLAESDYYSLGITIYELYTGHTPYAGADKEDIEKYIAIQKIPFPADFPKDLKKLILGLTYIDISNRQDKSNPNRRWTYDEVEQWCMGRKVAVPGEQSSVMIADNAPTRPFTFMYNKYVSVPLLVKALAEDWVNGEKRLYRSSLTEWFKAFDSDKANHCMDAEETVKRNVLKKDIEFFKVLYKLNPEMKEIYWKTRKFDSEESLGKWIIAIISDGSNDDHALFEEMIENNVFSSRAAIVYPRNQQLSKQLQALEVSYMMDSESHDEYKKQEHMYLLGFYLTGKPVLRTSIADFVSFESFMNYIHEIFRDEADFDSFSSDIMLRKGRSAIPSPEFAAWLIAIGEGEALK